MANESCGDFSRRCRRLFNVPLVVSSRVVNVMFERNSRRQTAQHLTDISQSLGGGLFDRPNDDDDG